MPDWLRCGRRVIGLIGGAALLFRMPLMSQTEPAFGIFVVSGSNSDVPALVQGTTDQEDSLNVQICDELAKGRAATEIAGHHVTQPVLAAAQEFFQIGWPRSAARWLRSRPPGATRS